VSDGYLDALGLQMVGGRFFGADDGLPGSEVAVINQRFVDMHLGGGDALGRRVRFGNQEADAPDDNWVTVVGVMPNIRQNAIQEVETDPVAYMPLRSNPVRQVALLVRTSANPGAATPLVREAMSAVQPDLPLFNIMTMDAFLAEQRWPFRVFGLMFSVFAGVALILSAVGLYSVTAHSVTQRTAEIGIRVAHGAQPRQVTWLVLRKALVRLAIGLPIGLVGAVFVGWALQSLVVQTSPIDPLTLGTIVGVLTVVAVVACVVPAQRAARLDPMMAFRVD
jgi:putative ABC transport system permease protein